MPCSSALIASQSAELKFMSSKRQEGVKSGLSVVCEGRRSSGWRSVQYTMSWSDSSVFATAILWIASELFENKQQVVQAIGEFIDHAIRLRKAEDVVLIIG